jgi:hypothetical protein
MSQALPRPGGPAPLGAPRAPRELGDTLSSIYKGSETALFVGPLAPNIQRDRITYSLPLNDRFLPRKRDIMLAGGAGFRPVEAVMVRRLTTIIAQADAGQGSTKTALFANLTVGGRNYPGEMTIGEFMALTTPQQLLVVDMAWEKVCERKTYNVLASSMFEPVSTTVAAHTEPVPSGMIPDSKGGYRCGWPASGGGAPTAFKTLGVGFRVDGSGDWRASDIKRVLTEGMTTQLRNVRLMRDIKGWTVDGTVVQRDTSGPRVWRTKNDLFNESAVCVSRNLYGATAFPMRDTGVDGPVKAVLWAVDVQGLVGFDTEAHQKAIPGARQWRPGEKAFREIKPGKLIAHVEIERTGEPPGGHGGWKFRVGADAKWTFVGSWTAVSTFIPSRELNVVNYINAQLKAWVGDQTIDGAYDFAT